MGVAAWVQRDRSNRSDHNHNHSTACMHGSGVHTWSDGRKYDGHYSHDKRDGKGKFTWANGKVYNGGWKDGKQHGAGTFFNPET